MGMSSSHQRIMGVPYQTRIQTSCLSYRRNFIQVGWLCCSLPEEFSNTVNKKVFLVSVDGTHVALNMTFLYGGQCMHAGIHLAYTSCGTNSKSKMLFFSLFFCA
jgi:hypothetical protein